jgi:histidine triad (HIT) family protein
MFTPDQHCVFCEIVAGRAPAAIVAEWPDAMAIVPLHEVTPGHLLVIPKGHVSDARVDPIVAGAAFARAASIATGPVNLITSAGSVATQTVFHLHVHVVPRRPGDGLSLPWTGQVSHVD